MSRYSKTQPRDEEGELRLAIMKLEFKDFLWRLPSIPDAQVNIALGISSGNWSGLKSTGDAPPRIVIGGRVFVLTADLRAWLDRREKVTVTKVQRNNEQHEQSDDDNDASPAKPTTAHPASLASGLLSASHPRR